MIRWAIVHSVVMLSVDFPFSLHKLPMSWLQNNQSENMKLPSQTCINTVGSYESCSENSPCSAREVSSCGQGNQHLKTYFAAATASSARPSGYHSSSEFPSNPAVSLWRANSALINSKASGLTLLTPGESSLGRKHTTRGTLIEGMKQTLTVIWNTFSTPCVWCF